MIHPNYSKVSMQPAVQTAAKRWREAYRAYAAASPQRYPNPAILDLQAAESNLNVVVEDASCGIRAA